MDDCLAESIVRHGACSPPLQSRCNPHTSKPVNWEKLRMSVNSVVIALIAWLAIPNNPWDCAWKSQPMQWKYSNNLSGP